MQKPEVPRKRRDWKGERVGTYVALPVELRSQLDALAERDGLPLGDVMTRMLAEAVGRPAPSFCYPVPDQGVQEELPLNQAS